MAINYELINKGGISLGTNFELLGEKPLDSRLVVPSLNGLTHLIAEKAAYAGMIVYVTSEDKHYQVNADGSYRQFGLTTEELNNIITDATTAAMEFKGATSSLPASGEKGDMYKVTAEFEVENIQNAQQTGGFTAKVGDSIVCNGIDPEYELPTWFLIPTGDDIEDTWRPIDGVDNDATISFCNDDSGIISAETQSSGIIKYHHAEFADPKLLAENEQTRTYITSVETDGHGHITGYKTATENVEDTNTTYNFECQVSDTDHSGVYFNVKASDSEIVQTVCLDAYTRNTTDNKLATKLDAGDWTNVDNVIALIKEETNSSAELSLSNLTIYDGSYFSSAKVKPGAIELLEAGDTYTHYNIGGIYYAREVPDPNETFEAYLSLPQKSGTLALQADVDAKLDANGWVITEGTEGTSLINSNGGQIDLLTSDGDTLYIYSTGIVINSDTSLSADSLTLYSTSDKCSTSYKKDKVVLTDHENHQSYDVAFPKASGTIALTSDLTDYHKDYQSGTIVDINHNNTTDPSFITGITIQNGHVTGATVQNLKEVLQNIIVVLDGGTLKIG